MKILVIGFLICSVIGIYVLLTAKTPQSASLAPLPEAVKSELAAPTGPVLLTISGEILNTNKHDTAQFDRDMLLALGTHDLYTTTSWTDGVKKFTGVRASDIMRTVGNTGTMITATALNDYTVDVPISDFYTYSVIFACEMDGKELHRRDKGPIWPVYPRDDFTELQDRDADKKWIYMLKEIVIR